MDAKRELLNKLISERMELKQKYDALQDKLVQYSLGHCELTGGYAQYVLMTRQRITMREYLDILGKRIDALKESEVKKNG